MVRCAESEPPRVERLHLNAKADVIVEVLVIEPGLHILAGLAQATDAAGEKLQGFHIAIRATLVVEGAPVLIFPRLTFVRRVFLHPCQDFAVTLGFGEFSLQRLRRDAGKTEPVSVNRVVVFVFARGSGEFGRAFV